jgi:hypothetical protein
MQKKNFKQLSLSQETLRILTGTDPLDSLQFSAPTTTITPGCDTSRPPNTGSFFCL